MRGYTMNRTDYLNRLRKIEGEVRGLQRVIEGDEYCIDLLTRLSSVTAVLQGANEAERLRTVLAGQRGCADLFEQPGIDPNAG